MNLVTRFRFWDSYFVAYEIYNPEIYIYITLGSKPIPAKNTANDSWVPNWSLLEGPVFDW